MRKFFALLLFLNYSFIGDAQNCSDSLHNSLVIEKNGFRNMKFISKVVCIVYLSVGEMNPADWKILKKIFANHSLELSKLQHTSLEFVLKGTNQKYYAAVRESKQLDRLIKMKQGTKIKIVCKIFKDFFIHGKNFFYVSRIII